MCIHVIYCYSEGVYNDFMVVRNVVVSLFMDTVQQIFDETANFTFLY